MKKTVIAAVLCAAVTFTAPLAAMAKMSYISVKNNSPQSKPVSYSYDGESETAKSIKTLMNKLSELDRQDSVVQTLTVTSESADGAPVDVKIRLSLPDTEADDGPSSPAAYDAEALYYYDIKVTSADGTVLYDGEDAAEADEGTDYRDIELGIMNETSDAENKIFNVTISVNKDMKDYAKTAEKLDWSIVTSASDALPTPTAAPEAENESEPMQSESTVPPVQATAAPTSAPSAAPATNSTVLPSGEYAVGHDIPAGRYTMTGSGKVHVYGEDGILHMTIALKHKGDSGANGVDEYVLTVKDGETVKVENEIMLSPFRSSVILPSASPSPSPSAAPNSGTGSAPTSAPKSSSSQNPKTGDTTPVVLISVIGAAALLSAAAIGVIKRKIRK